MRKALLLFAVFGLAGSLWAADPIIGTWKLNVEKSKMPPIPEAMRKEAPPKERIEVYREVDHDQIEYAATGTRTDGSSISSKWTWPRQGGIAVRHLPAPLPEGLSYVETLIEPGDWYVTTMQNGTQIGVFRKVISKDGKTMRQIYKDVIDQGIPIEAVLVFDRQ